MIIIIVLVVVQLSSIMYYLYSGDLKQWQDNVNLPGFVDSRSHGCTKAAGFDVLATWFGLAGWYPARQRQEEEGRWEEKEERQESTRAWEWWGGEEMHYLSSVDLSFLVLTVYLSVCHSICCGCVDPGFIFSN